MSKRILSLACMVMSVVLLLSMNVWTGSVVSASESTVQPRWSYTSGTSTNLVITTSGTATCSATATGYFGITTRVKIKMQLQQYLALQWTTIGSWEGTFEDMYGALSKTKTLTSSGNYRVKAMYTVYSGSASEAITMYSQEKYYTKK